MGVIGKKKVRRTDSKKSKNRREKAEYVRRLSHSLAHEIRNPLNVISLHLQMLEERCSSGEITKGENNIKIIKEEIERLRGVLDEFLRFAEPVKSKYDFHDLNRIIDEVIAFLDPESIKHGVEILKESAGEIPMIQIDRDSIKRVLYNLIINARRAMPQGGLITIRTQTLGDEVRIDVIDSGIGISEEDRGRIFDLFFTTRKEGVGLGLPIVEQVVEDHEGRVLVDSEVGGGSTFSVILPSTLEKNGQSDVGNND